MSPRLRRTLAIPLLTAALALPACDFLNGGPAQSPPAPSAEPAQPIVASGPASEPGPLPPPPETETTPPPEPPVEPGVQPTGAPTRGTLPKAAVTAGVSPGTAAFEACYLRALPAHPGLRGTIVVNFVVTRDGNVPHAEALEQGTDLPDDGVIECVLTAFKKLHFQSPSGDRAVITYPLKFEPTNDSR